MLYSFVNCTSQPSLTMQKEFGTIFPETLNDNSKVVLILLLNSKLLRSGSNKALKSVMGCAQ
jgi:hypothetical protein